MVLHRLKEDVYFTQKLGGKRMGKNQEDRIMEIDRKKKGKRN